ncbi:protein ALP1-like [Arachis ipaensis]|uniref:protein ALP1-like n=1 Tax=Arachis ipaensis TaxID=130454 RepID=UPI0007AF6F5C|nr:protein ALP1-like [Arachis ipaensis]XP_025661678.1 protein ALP1-like [Arachis hypogaea]
MDNENIEDANLEDRTNVIHDLEIQVHQVTSTDVYQPEPIQILTRVNEELEKRQNICVTSLTCVMVHALCTLELLSRYRPRQINDENLERENRRAQLMIQLLKSDKCRDVIRMSPEAFQLLCQKLRGTGRVKDSTRSTVEEQVAKFLHIIGHNVKTRTMSFFFHRSGETISRHFHNVLHAILSLEEDFFKQLSSEDVPYEIFHNSRFYPFFKDCIGAIDGTHSRVKVPRMEAPRFRGKKDHPTQNVLAACGFDMKFTYVLSGWEGTASDSRILKDALSREYPLRIPEGKFYLGDAGFMLKPGVLTPYRGVRYHLKEYSVREPQNPKELFNHHHSSLRNVIERCFGVLKKRFPIIAGDTEPYYSFKTMRDIFLACCILHNFLMGVDVDQSIIEAVDRELLQERNIDRSQSNQQRDEEYRYTAMLRDNIAAEMWNVYQTL